MKEKDTILNKISEYNIKLKKKFIKYFFFFYVARNSFQINSIFS